MTSSRTEKIFFEVFEPLPRQGPGNLASTRRALSHCVELPLSPQVLDLGCGAGAQTLHLASLMDGPIIAIDRHAPLIQRLRAKSEDMGLSTRIDAKVADMSALNLPTQSFDLVWSEGALYNIGLATALPLCTGLLRTGGYLAFTEAVWRTNDAPPEVRSAFSDYPTMGRVEDVLTLIEKSGLSLIENFDLPDEAWWDDFYSPMEENIEALRTRYIGDDEALKILEDVAKEPMMHRRSSRYYSYTFFIARRV